LAALPAVVEFKEARAVSYRRVNEDEGILSVHASFDDGANSYEHRLVQSARERDGRKIVVPVERVICLSSTYLGFLGEIGALDRVVGVSSRRHVANREVLSRIERGEVVEVGDGMPIDTEKLLACRPDLVVTFGVNEKDVEPFASVVRAGVPVLVVAEYTEDSPLGRAEWIKVFGLLVGKTKESATRYDSIARRYEEFRKRARSVVDRPTVLLNASFQGIWYMPGGTSYMARLLADAGADYPWKDERASRVLTLDFETVLQRAGAAKYWLNVGFWKTLAEGLANDSRYRHFEAFAAGRVYNHMTEAKEDAGTDYFERGAVRPDWMLGDLLGIFHPELVPDHEMVWYRRLRAE
jgi:iron complex transport system substrate-binding protein